MATTRRNGTGVVGLEFIGRSVGSACLLSVCLLQQTRRLKKGKDTTRWRLFACLLVLFLRYVLVLFISFSVSVYVAWSCLALLKLS
ncbi:hypothetical protein B0H65DRAFT_158752 [Neurospora tetraspora]|uniref:Uncharacterized protein n=1 Tax=Neurospora tetraspora TaxID=94610 RepID=A0AAE0JHF9_9PEZI|nr:hypothetical protein B0H65DRAFT_158752 [Neurospora tetraspora]